MSEAKCPACRKRFSLDAKSMGCSRCGADLTLLIKMRRHARRLVVKAFAADSMSEDLRRERLLEAQRVCYSPEVQLLLEVTDVRQSKRRGAPFC